MWECLIFTVGRVDWQNIQMEKLKKVSEEEDWKLRTDLKLTAQKSSVRVFLGRQ